MISRRVTVSSRAKRELEAARAWLSQPGAGRVAASRAQAIEQALVDLARHPCRFPLTELSGLRSRLVSGYRIFYRVRPDTGDDETAGDVTVTRVFAPYQDRSNV